MVVTKKQNSVTEQTRLKFHESTLYKIITDTPAEDIAVAARAAVFSNDEDLQLRDVDTGATYLHLATDYVTKFTDARALPGFYCLLYAGLEPSIQTTDTGETPLHKLVRQPGSYKLIIALLRYGVDVSLKDAEGQTALDILMNTEPEGHKDTLTWIDKFSPGLYCALIKPNCQVQTNVESIVIDDVLIERLLKSWCKVIIRVNGKFLNLLNHTQLRAKDAAYASLLKKHCMTNELVHATLAGITPEMKRLHKEGKKKIDVDTRDSSYQYNMSSPQVPQPLLAAAWEQENFDVIDQLIKMDVDVCNSYSNMPDTNPRKPMFYQPLLGQPRLNNLTILAKLLESADLRCKTELGRTYLHEAVRFNLPPAFVKRLFELDVPLDEREQMGLTAKQFAVKEGNMAIAQTIDDHIIDLAKTGQLKRLEVLALHSYELDEVKTTEGECLLQLSSKGAFPSKISKFLTSIPQLTRQMYTLWTCVSLRDNTRFKQLLYNKDFKTAIYSRDKCGRSVLLQCLCYKNIEMLKMILKKHPKLVEYFDNMLLTSLHYAFVLYDDNTDEVVKLLKNAGASLDWCCTGGKGAIHYSRSAMGDEGYFEFQSILKSFGTLIMGNKDELEEKLKSAATRNDKDAVMKVMEELRMYGGLDLFKTILFDAIDAELEEMCVFLIENGAEFNIKKQYETCTPENELCAMMECFHPETSLLERAKELGYQKLTQIIEHKMADPSYAA